MKSLERRFNNITKKNPYWISYTCFVAAIRGQNFSERTIRRWFNKLVEKDDYAKDAKKAILGFLINFTTPLRKVENEDKLPL